MTTIIWWLRRDLRLTDNPALTTALQEAEVVVPVFIFDPLLLASPYLADKRLAFLLGGLRHLATALEERGSRLIIRRGEPVIELTQLMAETEADRIVAQEDFSPYARRRDTQVAEALPLTLTDGVAIHHPTSVLKQDGEPYVVFTPYSRSWQTLPLPGRADLLPQPSQLPPVPALSSEAIPAEPTLPETVPFPPGEAEGQRRLQAFMGVDDSATEQPPIAAYAENRNRLDLAGTSRLSAYFRLGLVSARQAAVMGRQLQAETENDAARQSITTWLNELVWRDFYLAILYHFPQVRRENFRDKFAAFPWRNDRSAFEAWGDGRTGYPVVDAAMRQLVQTGWLPNRARMIVASFLVKHLLIDWRWGERWFMQHLVDGDPAANNGGWQWTAGSGTDAAPYFRIFNPILQSEKFDPTGQYIRRWLPALAEVPTKFIHTPWKMAAADQQKANCHLGSDYPAPIVDHSEARQRALAAYDQVKN